LARMERPISHNDTTMNHPDVVSLWRCVKPIYY